MANLEQYFHHFCVRNSRVTRGHKLISFYKKNVDRSRTRILIACMPKSGSTFLSELLQRYYQFPDHSLAWAYGKSEQEIYWPKLSGALGSDALFVHQHVRASENTVEAIRLFNIHTIVMIRNLFDVVVSIRDHFRNESLDSSMAFVEKDFLQWDDRRQYEFVIDLILPWYLNFLGTWIDAGKQKDIHLLWLNYSDWVHEPEPTLKKIDEFCGLPYREAAAAEAVTLARKGSIRLNVGKSGRGREFLDEELQAKVRHLVSYYPGCEPYKAQLL